jgi:sigma-B regulation protein RsbU (phosphoserine phosphatase)
VDAQEIAVAKGDRVFLFSDGLLEKDAQGSVSRRIGLANLINLINENSSARLETTVKTIQERLFPDPQKMDDDAVLLGFEVL